jgi:hypothetical protein
MYPAPFLSLSSRKNMANTALVVIDIQELNQ